MVICSALTACQSEAVSPTARPISSPTPPLPTAIPPIRVISHHLSQSHAPGEWRVVGLTENHSQNVVSQVRLKVSLLDATGNVVAEESAATLMSNLLPGEVGPFSVGFEGVAAPAEAQVETLRHEPANATTTHDRPNDVRPELIAELDEFFVIGSGELAIMGFVSNPGNRHIALDSLGLLGRAPNDSEKSLEVGKMLYQLQYIKNIKPIGKTRQKIMPILSLWKMQ